MYPISEQLLSLNRSDLPLNPQGFVIHSTADPGATAQNEHDFFNSGDRQASAHYFVDWSQTINTVPELEQAWHAGPTANRKYLSAEMCEPETYNPVQFLETWLRTISLVSDACRRYGWGKDKIFSHADISNTYHETDHLDPVSFFAQYGKTMDDFRSAVITAVTKPSQPMPVLAKGIANKGAVITLQTKLNNFGYGLDVDGDFGNMTDSAVRQFQRSKGLVADGICGPMTWGKLG